MRGFAGVWLGSVLLGWLAGAAVVSAQTGEPVPVMLHCGKLLAVPGEPVREEVTLVVRGERIEAIQSGYRSAVDIGVPEGGSVRVVDLKDQFVLPGLIDAHTHITSEYGPDARLRRVRDSDADAALRGVVYAKRTLDAGFTTIRNVGSAGDSVFALRDAIAAGAIEGPRILAAGEAITPTGGHGDGTLGYREGLFDVQGPEDGVADGVGAARRAVRTQVKRGADVIKITATGGVLSVSDAGTDQQFFEDELRAIVETAHMLGRKVAAHAHGADGINAALRAGVDSIDHGTFLDETSIALFKETGAFLVPTVIAGKTVEERATRGGYFPPSVEAKARRVGPQSQDALRRAVAGGVRVAFGTDSGVSAHGDNAREFTYMVEAGMTPIQAIESATVHAAALLGLEREIGTIATGKSADLIAVAQDPTRDVKALERVLFVMHRGRIAKQEDTP